MHGLDEVSGAGHMTGVSTAPAPPPGPQALRPDKDLLAAWLLLLLREGTSYGYELRREIRARRLQIDSGNLYRWLRRLEGEGLVHSRWTQSAVGPQRRSYRLTAKGRRTLAEIATVISRMRDNQDAFLQAYEPARRSAAERAA